MSGSVNIESSGNSRAGCGARHGLLGSAVIIALMLMGSYWVSAQTPPGARLPVHWNAAGKVDQYGTAFQGLWLMPLIGAGASLLLAMITRWEPRRAHIQQSMRAYVMIWLSIMLVLLAAHTAALATILGYGVNMTRVMLVAVGLMFIVIGNYMGKLRSNFFAGVRSPWTLSSELSWNKTHRLAGKMFVVLGLLTFAVCWAEPTAIIVLFAAAIPLMVIVLMVYSYLVWKSDPDRQQIGRISS